MRHHHISSFFAMGTTVIACGVFTPCCAEDKAGGYDYSHRMRDCNITVKINGQGVSGAEISVKQIRNHFGFGASINRWAFDTIGEAYGQAFLKYFDIGTPENEMKWEYVFKHDTTQKTEPAYERADYLVDFLQKNDIAIRGHNLFWNEHTGWIPRWILYTDLTQAQFKQEMQERIESAMTHFNGKVVQWDIINEIVHGRGGSTPAPTMLDSASGDPNIFKWILQEARTIDTTSKFVINDYNLIERYSVVDKFIAKVKPLADYYDIVGCEGHFGDYLEKSDYLSKIDNLANQLNKPIWLTEVDFTITSNQAAKVEELMRTCFAHKKIEGLIFWVWCKRRMWRENCTSYLVDSTLQESAVGKKWREVREEWKTKANGVTNASGNYSFKGYQGKYIATINNGGTTIIDTFYLEPGSGAKAIDLPKGGAAITRGGSQHGDRVPVRVNGRTIYLLPPIEGRQLYLSTFSICGKLFSKTPLFVNNGTCVVSDIPSGCHVLHIGTVERTFYTAMEVQLR
ncbi:MAG: endo-1,4-beta-xylanase [Chitinispirillaceae bacterium]|nr:endo-1,4-beta-xylanase [Chitinispirillaceae bacterium]